MLAALNSKRLKYDPVRYMANREEMERRAAAERAARPPMTGEQILDRFRALGVPIIDKRVKPSGAIQ